MDGTTTLFLRVRRAGALALLLIGVGSVPALADNPPTPAAPGTEQLIRFPKVSRESLRYDGKSFDEWRTEVLTELKPEKRVDGMKALVVMGRHGYATEATASILDMVKDFDIASHDTEVGDNLVGVGGMEAVQLIGTAAIPVLAEALSNNSRNIRHFAAKSLKWIDSTEDIWKDATAAIPALKNVLADKDPLVREAAVHALSAIDPSAEGLLPLLLEALADPQSDVKCEALKGIALLGPNARAAVPKLVSVLPVEDDRTRSFALESLRSIKPDLKDIIDPVMKYCVREDSVDPGVVPLLQCYGKEGVKSLVVALKKADGFEKYVIIRALGDMGPTAAEAVQELEHLADKNDGQLHPYNIREEVTEALSKIRPTASEKTAPP
jgi:hypothetical protein